MDRPIKTLELLPLVAVLISQGCDAPALTTPDVSGQTPKAPFLWAAP
jgi:hypothetical protein